MNAGNAADAEPGAVPTGEIAATRVICPERTRTVNTTAAGGNASLLTLGD